jgi:hypothetical protein
MRTGLADSTFIGKTAVDARQSRTGHQRPQWEQLSAKPLLKQTPLNRFNGLSEELVVEQREKGWLGANAGQDGQSEWP